MSVVKDGYLSLLVAVRLTIDKQFGFVRGIYPQQTSLQHASIGQNEVYLTLKGDHIALCLAFHHIPTTFQRFIIVVPITRKLSTVVTRLRLGLHLLAGTVPGTFQVGDLSLSRQHREQTDQTTGGKQISSLHLTFYLLHHTSYILLHLHHIAVAQLDVRIVATPVDGKLLHPYPFGNAGQLVFM